MFTLRSDHISRRAAHLPLNVHLSYPFPEVAGGFQIEEAAAVRIELGIGHFTDLRHAEIQRSLRFAASHNAEPTVTVDNKDLQIIVGCPELK